MSALDPALSPPGGRSAVPLLSPVGEAESAPDARSDGAPASWGGKAQGSGVDTFLDQVAVSSFFPLPLRVVNLRVWLLISKWM